MLQAIPIWLLALLASGNPALGTALLLAASGPEQDLPPAHGEWQLQVAVSPPPLLEVEMAGEELGEDGQALMNFRRLFGGPRSLRR